MQAKVQTYKNTEGKQAFKVVAPYKEGNILKSRVKKFNPIDKRPDRKRDFYGPLPSTEIPLKAKKLEKTFKEGYG